MKRLVLIGGGHSHLYVLEAFGRERADRVEVTLITRVPFAAYSGMLPGLIAGHYSFHDCHINLETLTRFSGTKLVLAEARSLDLSQKQVLLPDGAAVAFDVLSIDIGSIPPALNARVHQDAILKVKPIESFLPAWDALQVRILDSKSLFRLAIIGAGAAGVELALAMQFKLTQVSHEQGARVEFHIVTDTDVVLPCHSRGVRKTFERILDSRDIKVHARSRVAAADSKGLYFDDGRDLACDSIVCATGASAPARPAQTGLKANSEGFIVVNDHLQSVSHEDVFAAGDIAHQHDHPRPKSGVFAVRQGPPLAANLRRALLGQPLITFVPQRRALALISTGDRSAVMSWGAFSLEGAWVWRWKDKIDRRFVDRFNRLG